MLEFYFTNLLSEIVQLLQEGVGVFGLLIPIGLIGIWRWVFWLTKRIIGLFYQTPKGSYRAKLGVITPVYNEDPIVFQKALNSWKQNRVDEIIAVIDYTDKQSIRIFRNFCKKFPQGKEIITKKPGKREALADGIKAAKSEILALVDSDVVWEKSIKTKMLAPFADPKVGGVAVRQDVLNPNTLARRLFKIHLDLRFLVELPFLAVVGDALTVLSGRTAVYRKRALRGLNNKLVNETFWGRKVISGDDKRLTQLVQANGWKTRYLRDIRVYTQGAADLATYAKQRLRWARNVIRSDLKTISSAWVWKREKPLALYLLDRFVPPIVLLLGPVFMITAFLYHKYALLVILIAWLLVSRTLKLAPHLIEVPRDIVLIPLYVLMSYAEALGKIYAFLTMNEQGWITRWSKNRLKQRSYMLLRETPTVLLVMLIPISMLVVSINWQENSLQKAEIKRIALETKQIEKKLAAARDPRGVGFKKELKLVAGYTKPDYPINNIRQELYLLTQGNQFGYYKVQLGDTIPKIVRKFNLSQIGQIQSESSLSNQPLARVLTGQIIKIPVAELRTPLDINVAVTPLRTLRALYAASNNTITVSGEGNVVNLTTIRNALPVGSQGLLENNGSGEWVLRANLVLNQGVTLVLKDDEIKEFRLLSNPEKFVWLRSDGGNILISKVKINSWDENQQVPDQKADDGRAYITARGSGRMDILDSEISYLGYLGGERRGGLFGGSYGVSWKIESGTFPDNLLTGVVINNKIHHNYFGLYTFGATGIVIRNNEVYENDQYGIDPHDDSNNLLIENNQVYSNGTHGIIASKRCFQITIKNNISHDNRLHGIMLDRQSNNNIVENNVVWGNEDGIALYDSHKNVIVKNKIQRNRKSGVRMNMKSSENFLENNQIANNTRGIYLYGRSANNYIFNNEIENNQTGISIKDSEASNFYNNLKPGNNKSDLYVTRETDKYDIK